jgi:predicted nucleic acid-binding protein
MSSRLSILDPERTVRGKDVLIHNLSHADMILGIKTSNQTESVVARPKFNQFNSISNDLYQKISESPKTANIYNIEGLPTRTSDPSQAVTVPIGYEFPQNALFSWSSDLLRFRDEDKARSEGLICSFIFS